MTLQAQSNQPLAEFVELGNQNLDVVAPERRIGAKDRQPELLGLSDQQPVKRVPMVPTPKVDVLLSYTWPEYMC